ncbi:MAG: T9SS type A sorting domain-containing protein [Saprospiraceae bacterium]
MFPNSTEEITNVSIDLENSGQVEIQVFNAVGQLVKTLTNETLDAGKHQFSWDASQQAAGNYFIQFNLDGKTVSKQVSKVER